MKRLFEPQIKTIGVLDSFYDEETIKNETMLFQADIEFCEKNSVIAREIVKQIPSKFDLDKYVIDTRVSMLMPGYYPSIPGWHCDNFPRRNDNGQPDLESGDDAHHIMCLIGTSEGVSNTEFVVDKVDYELDENDVWSSLHKQIEINKPKTSFVRNNEIIEFNQNAIHRSSPAKVRGWRLFFRLSKCGLKPKNEIRRQTQVYLLSDNGGW